VFVSQLNSSATGRNTKEWKVCVRVCVCVCVCVCETNNASSERLNGNNMNMNPCTRYYGVLVYQTTEPVMKLNDTHTHTHTHIYI